MSVDTIYKNLRAMRAAGKVMDIKAKGAAGEAAAFDIVHEYRTKRGGILKQGFMYPYASNRQGQVYLGNIFWDEEKQKFYDKMCIRDSHWEILSQPGKRLYPLLLLRPVLEYFSYPVELQSGLRHTVISRHREHL